MTTKTRWPSGVPVFEIAGLDEALCTPTEKFNGRIVAATCYLGMGTTEVIDVRKGVKDYFHWDWLKPLNTDAIEFLAVCRSTLTHGAIAKESA